MTKDSPPSKSIKSTKTAFDIVESIKNQKGATISEIASDVEISRSTIHGHLITLQDLGYVVRKDEQYQIGIRFLDLGTYARSCQPVFKNIKPKVERLAEETNEQVEFIIEEQGRSVYIYRKVGSHAVQLEDRVGRRRYIHTSAGGQAILSQLSKQRIKEIIGQWGLVKKTPHTITSQSELFDRLEEIRERGYSRTDSESVNGLRALAAPIGGENHVYGAICISGPSNRLSDSRIEEDLSSAVLGVANEVELSINYSN